MLINISSRWLILDLVDRVFRWFWKNYRI